MTPVALDVPASEVDDRVWAGFGGRLGFDVGAHTGESLARMAAVFDHVVALEPESGSFRALAAGWGAREKVTALHMAAGDRDGTMELAEREFPLRCGMLCGPGAWDGARPGMAGWWTRETGRRVVPCVTLDTLAATYGTPDFVKVDTEGCEEMVLAGAAGLIAGGATSWLVEFHNPRLRSAVLDLLGGYRVEWVRNPPEAEDHGGDTSRDETGWLLAWPA